VFSPWRPCVIALARRFGNALSNGGNPMSRYAHLAFTESVQQVQREEGSWLANSRLVRDGGSHPDVFGPDEAAFIEQRDGFYIASVSATGWPYVQFRGGPSGFVHVLNETTLGYADVRGNRQYITSGNLRTDDRVSLFFMDYVRQARMKVFGHASVRALDEDPELAGKLCALRTDGRVERLVLIAVEGFSWNCRQHIPQRFSLEDLAEVRAQVTEVQRENRALAQENAALRERLGVPDAPSGR
jgi:predicted pyridoxine 5'-phosphate oxidase superfamily flavin-nucleotide-binding protein